MCARSCRPECPLSCRVSEAKRTIHRHREATFKTRSGLSFDQFAEPDSLVFTLPLIGYNNTKYWGDLEAHQRWADLRRSNGGLLCEAFEKAGARAIFDPSIELLRMNDTVNICFALAKCRKFEGQPLKWRVRRRVLSFEGGAGQAAEGEGR